MLPQLLHLHIRDLTEILLPSRQVEKARILLQFAIQKLLVFFVVGGVVRLTWAEEVFEDKLVNFFLEYLAPFQYCVSVLLSEFSMSFLKQVSDHVGHVVSVVAHLGVLGGFHADKRGVVNHCYLSKDLSLAGA